MIFRKNQRFASTRWLLSYLVIALVVAGCAGFTYYESQGIITENIEKYTLEMLVNVRDLVDVRMENVAGTITKLASSYQTNMVMLAEDPIENAQMYAFKDYITLISTINTPTDITDDVLVYSDRNRYIFSSTSAMNIEGYYRQTYKEASSGKFEQWMDERIRGCRGGVIYPDEHILIDGMYKRVIPYVQSFPLGSRHIYQGSICVMINYDALFSGFVNSGMFGDCYVKDSAGNLIAALREKGALVEDLVLPETLSGFFTQSINGSKMIVAYAKSQRTGLSFITVTPYSAVMKQVSQLRMIFYLSIAFCLLISLWIAWGFVKRNVPPISEIYQLLFDHVGGEWEYGSYSEYIQRSVKKILEDNTEMQTALNQQLVEMQVSNLNHLLAGDFFTNSEMEAAISQLALTKGNYYLGVILHIVGYNNEISKNIISELCFHKARIRQLLEPMQDYVIMLDTGIDQLSIVFSFRMEKPEHCYEYAGLIIKDLKRLMEEEQVTLTASGGNVCGDLSELYRSYWEAQQIESSIALQTKEDICWYKDNDAIKQIFYYPTEVEQRILTNVRSGNHQLLQELLDKVFAVNFQELHIASAMETILYSELKATLLKSASEVFSKQHALSKMQDYMTAFGAATSTESVNNIFKMAFGMLCEEICNKKASHNSELKSNVVAFIHQKGLHPDMSLTMVASEFGLSSSYLSSFFKEQTGENFLTYVETLRLDTARDLLNKRRHTVEEISSLVGYTSAHSFRRAFKRRYGESPASLMK